MHDPLNLIYTKCLTETNSAQQIIIKKLLSYFYTIVSHL